MAEACQDLLSLKGKEQQQAANPSQRSSSILQAEDPSQLIPSWFYSNLLQKADLIGRFCWEEGGLSKGWSWVLQVSDRVPAWRNPLVCTSMRSWSGPDSVLRKPYEHIIMGPCADTETGRKPEFLITYGHKGDRGIFCRAGCRRFKPQGPARMGQREPCSIHRPHRALHGSGSCFRIHPHDNNSAVQNQRIVTAEHAWISSLSAHAALAPISSFHQ